MAVFVLDSRIKSESFGSRPLVSELILGSNYGQSVFILSSKLSGLDVKSRSKQLISLHRKLSAYA